MNTTVSTRSPRPRRLTRQGRKAVSGALFILPSFVLMLAFSILPMFMALYYSFTKFNIANAPEWIGLQNYVKLFTNSYLHQSLINTATYVIVTVPLQTLFALFIAAFLADRMNNRAGGVLRSVMFIPVIASLIASATVWRIIYDSNGGLINQVLEALGGQSVNFLGSKYTALYCVAAVAIWKNTGYFLVIYYAGIMNISVEIREASIVDGA